MADPGRTDENVEPHIVPLSTQALRRHSSAQAQRPVEVGLPEPVEHAEAHQRKHCPVRPLPDGLPLGMTGHGFRGLASTILNEHGFESDWIEGSL